jgi:hypothetical protein
MINYLRQKEICRSIQKTIKLSLTQYDDISVRRKASDIPTAECILRAVSILPSLDTEEKLKDFIIEHITGSLYLTPIQREHLNLND